MRCFKGKRNGELKTHVPEAGVAIAIHGKVINSGAVVWQLPYHWNWCEVHKGYFAKKFFIWKNRFFLSFRLFLKALDNPTSSCVVVGKWHGRLAAWRRLSPKTNATQQRPFFPSPLLLLLDCSRLVSTIMNARASDSGKEGSPFLPRLKKGLPPMHGEGGGSWNKDPFVWSWDQDGERGRRFFFGFFVFLRAVWKSPKCGRLEPKKD